MDVLNLWGHHQHFFHCFRFFLKFKTSFFYVWIHSESSLNQGVSIKMKVDAVWKTNNLLFHRISTLFQRLTGLKLCPCNNCICPYGDEVYALSKHWLEFIRSHYSRCDLQGQQHVSVNLVIFFYYRKYVASWIARVYLISVDLCI